MGGLFNEGENIDFSATVSDAQDQPDEVSLDWNLNGASVSTQGATSEWNCRLLRSKFDLGSYSLVLTGTDTDGLTDLDQINFTVNGLPSQPVISITPDPADTNDAFDREHCHLDRPRRHCGELQLRVVDGRCGSIRVYIEYGAFTATNKNEQWTVRVTPNDGIADGPVGESTIAIANTPPTLSALTITPASNVTNDITLSASVVVTDPDEALTPAYEWSIGSSVVGSGTTLDLSASGAMPNDVVTCTAAVVDGDGATASGSATSPYKTVPPVSHWCCNHTVDRRHHRHSAGLRSDRH